MFPLGHLGFTLLAWRGAGLLPPRLAIATMQQHAQEALGSWGAVPLVLLGAVLPDLLDKPLGHLVLGLGNGRLLGHTLAFTLGFAGTAWLLQRGGRTRAGATLSTVAFGTGMHLVLDRMWLDPPTLLWPLLGWRFPVREFEAVRWVDALLRDPMVFVPEVLGGLILAWELGRWWGVRGGSGQKGVVG